MRSHLKDKSFFAVSLGADEPEWNRFNIVIRKIGAQVTACIQSLHAIPDILASAVYYSCALDKTYKPAKGKFVNHAFVAAILANEPELALLRRPFTKVTQGKGYKQLAAIANKSKHYSIIFPALNADLTGTRAEQYLITIPCFASGKTNFEKVFVTEFVAGEHERLSRLVIECGHALNAHLRNAA